MQSSYELFHLALISHIDLKKCILFVSFPSIRYLAYFNLDISIADEDIVNNVESTIDPVSPVNEGDSIQAMVSSNEQHKTCLGEKESASSPKDACSPNNGNFLA